MLGVAAATMETLGRTPMETGSQPQTRPTLHNMQWRIWAQEEALGHLGQTAFPSGLLLQGPTAVFPGGCGHTPRSLPTFQLRREDSDKWGEVRSKEMREETPATKPGGQDAKASGGGRPAGLLAHSGRSPCPASGHRRRVGMEPASPCKYLPDNWPQTQSNKYQL